MLGSAAQSYFYLSLRQNFRLQKSFQICKKLFPFENVSTIFRPVKPTPTASLSQAIPAFLRTFLYGLEDLPMALKLVVQLSKEITASSVLKYFGQGSRLSYINQYIWILANILLQGWVGGVSKSARWAHREPH